MEALKQLFELKKKYKQIDIIINRMDCDTKERKCYIKTDRYFIKVFLYSDDTENFAEMFALCEKEVTRIEKELLYDMNNPNAEKAILSHFEYYNNFINK